MNSVTTLEIASKKPEDTLAFGVALGGTLEGGEVIELIGDLGAGKTQLVRGLAQGIGSREAVQSPSFTISRIYHGKSVELNHYDFYRINSDPGILKQELSEKLTDPKVSIVTEWAENDIGNLLPKDRLKIVFSYGQDENHRKLKLTATGDNSKVVLEKLR